MAAAGFDAKRLSQEVSRAGGSEAASLELFTVAPASVPVPFLRTQVRQSILGIALDIPAGATEKNRHGGRRYGQSAATVSQEDGQGDDSPIGSGRYFEAKNRTVPIGG